MQIHLTGRNQSAPDSGKNKVYLRIDNWNDFGFVTTFDVTAFDENGKRHDLGAVKIGFSGQTTSEDTYSTLECPLENLPDNYFSLGLGTDYYEAINKDLSENFAENYLDALRDIVHNPDNFEKASGEDVFHTSFLRGISIYEIREQFLRVLKGGALLTDFNFTYERPEEELAGIELAFNVAPNSKPITNIHAIIGRNGVGKTTLLNGMIEAIIEPNVSKGAFYDQNLPPKNMINPHYFSRLVSVSFSAFDPFPPPLEQTNPEQGTCYYYIGLKKQDNTLKPINDLHEEFINSLQQCIQSRNKRERWESAILTLESDGNFAEMNLSDLTQYTGDELETHAKSILNRMSSGHAIVLLIITELVAKVEEKTLVLLDEPESHLHPPLLSALTRALSELLFNRNGVAIIATHSPVVLQEVPKSCVWKITRFGRALSAARPEIETFGENVGTLTREVFGLELTKSGYHTILSDEVNKNLEYDEIVENFDGQLGFEAKAVLRALVANRDEESSDV